MEFMKRRLIVLLLLVFTLSVSCESGKLNAQNLEPTLSEAEKSNIINRLETVFSAQAKKPVKFTKSKLIKIDGISYLRLWHEDKVTTTLLNTQNKRTLVDAGVSCTSTACANSPTGCIPDSETGCSECTEDPEDCTRTISG